ncbi:dTDP-4-dehydrorhamnose reductase [Herbidospora solisilvae]|uniref:dTDP-4-dehydrorhamnose reductase n=1 Tax=Herbidospora solisilvae TaxID=2696284 RepID=UPI002E2994A2|nr:dTDP-4-dehydrorhamnose reductase [Herbidospora solisilvae]
MEAAAGLGVTRWLVTGGGGMLASDLVRVLDGAEVRAPTRAELDITDAAALSEAVDWADVVVNCAAWTAVDDAETNEEAALRVNAPHALAERAGRKLVHLSTDYVFSGERAEPWPEDAPTGPINAYGRTKLAGEQVVLAHHGTVVRTAWLYGAHGPSFVRTMARLERSHEVVTVVDDQHGQPTWTNDLARRIVDLVGSGAHGVFHGTNSGATTWHGLAQEVFRLLGANPARVRPVASDAFPRPAPRPKNSVLAHGAWASAGLKPMRDWREALHEAWPEL